MTARIMYPAVGKRVLVRLESLEVSCVVLDVKQAWGRYRLQVRPVAGEGQAWIDLDRVIRLEEPAGGQGAELEVRP